MGAALVIVGRRRCWWRRCTGPNVAVVGDRVLRDRRRHGAAGGAHVDRRPVQRRVGRTRRRDGQQHVRPLAGQRRSGVAVFGAIANSIFGAGRHPRRSGRPPSKPAPLRCSSGFWWSRPRPRSPWSRCRAHLRLWGSRAIEVRRRNRRREHRVSGWPLWLSCSCLRCGRCRDLDRRHRAVQSDRRPLGAPSPWVGDGRRHPPGGRHESAGDRDRGHCVIVRQSWGSRSETSWAGSPFRRSSSSRWMSSVSADPAHSPIERPRSPWSWRLRWWWRYSPSWLPAPNYRRR